MRRIEPRLWNAIVTTVGTSFFAFVGGFVYGAASTSGCENVLASEAVFGCAEFVLFRYQTLIGVVAALAIAAMAARPVWQQLHELRRQSAIQSYEMLRRYTAVIEEERRLATEARLESQYALVVERNITIDSPPSPQATEVDGWSYFARQRHDALERLIGVLDVAGVNKWGDARVQRARTTMYGKVCLLRTAVSWIADQQALPELTVAQESSELRQAADAYLKCLNDESARLAPLVSNAARAAIAAEAG